MDLKEHQQGFRHRHPWELSRADCMGSLVPGLSKASRVADIGAGDAFFADRLFHRTGVQPVAVDDGYTGREEDDGIVRVRHLEELEPGSFDAVFCMDVLEHVVEEGAFVRSVADLLRWEGMLIVTVPAHPRLFSAHDRFLGHHRRYTRRRLRSVLEAGGLEVQELFAFYAIPLCIRTCEVLLQRFRILAYRDRIVGWKSDEHDGMTRFVRALLNIDFRIGREIQRCLPVSLGLSLCAVCRRRREA